MHCAKRPPPHTHPRRALFIRTFYSRCADCGVDRLRARMCAAGQRQRDQRKKSLTIKARIRQAGMSFSPSVFWMISAGAALTGALIAFITGQNLLVLAAITLISGFGLPRWWLGFLCGRRQKKFTAEFANSLDVITRGVKSGLPLNECLKILATESPEPVRTEFEKL